MTKPTQAVGVQIGASKDAIAEARIAIMQILNSGNDQDTLRAALSILGDLCSVKNTSITGCTISAGGVKDGE